MSTQPTQAGAQAQPAPKTEQTDHKPRAETHCGPGCYCTKPEQAAPAPRVSEVMFTATTGRHEGGEWNNVVLSKFALQIEQDVAYWKERAAKWKAVAFNRQTEKEDMAAELAETKAQRDALLEDMNQIAMRANFMLVRDPMNNQADYILQQAKAAMARCEEEEKAEAGK